VLIAAAGLAGAGKTTALTQLAAMGAGHYVYVGGIVSAEVERRGLSSCPDTERLVRAELRRTEGPAALASRAAPDLRRRLDAGETLLIDAICNPEEAAFYCATFADALVILALETPYALRAERLGARPVRPLSAEQLSARDSYELTQLDIGKVLGDADVTIDNGGTLEQLEAQVRAFATARLTPG